LIEFRGAFGIHNVLEPELRFLVFPVFPLRRLIPLMSELSP